MDGKELGRPGSYVLFENDHVKVWQNNLEPGESSDWHEHTNHYLFVATEHGELRVEFEDGTSNENELQLGQVVMGEKDSVHKLSNRGNKPYSSVIVEIKK